jgi:transglutaminase-like putative cysteine protease
MIGISMNRVRRITIPALLLLAMGLLITSSHMSRAELITVQGEMDSSVTAYLTRRFSSYSTTKNLTYRMYLPASQTEGLHTQTISRLRKSFTPFPTETREFVDEYGNSGIDLIWNKEIRIIQLDLQFTAQVFSNFYPIDSNAPYPMATDERFKPYLVSTDLSPSNDFMINYIGRSLAYGLNREVDVVKNVFLWLDDTIKMAKNAQTQENHDALSVLKLQQGDERGICNLASSIFKGLGIPARVVYGISFQQEIGLETEQGRYLFDFPNDEKLWLEVYFPDLGWISYDPVGMHFGTVSHVVRFSVGPDSDYPADRWDIEQGDIIEFKEFIFDIRADNINLQPHQLDATGSNRIILSAAVKDFKPYTKEPELEVGRVLDENENEEEQSPPAQADVLMQNSDITSRLDIVATQNRIYAQQITVDDPLVLTEVQLPLIKFSDEGRIWLELYSDENGKPGKVVFKTFSIHSPRIRFMMMDNPWLSFPVGSKTDSFLDSGAYWIALRSSGSCIFNWFASCGNVVGASHDTRFRDVSQKGSGWDNILNFDMTFQLIGRPQDQ